MFVQNKHVLCRTNKQGTELSVANMYSAQINVCVILSFKESKATDLSSLNSLEKRAAQAGLEPATHRLLCIVEWSVGQQIF